MKNFIIYKRLSKQKQEGNQYGFDSQQADLDHFLSSIGDYKILGEFGEFFTGKGNWKDRKELVKAVEMCKATGASLLVSKIDRLGRNVASVASLLEMVDVKVATMPSATNMVVQILSSVAEEEVRSISARVTAALKVAKEKNKVKCGAAVHMNKHRVGQKLQSAVDNIYKKEDIKKIIESNIKSLTYKNIASILNNKGYLYNKGKEFNQDNVSYLCKKWGISR